MIVEYLKEISGIISYKIIPEKEYPENYEETLQYVQNEQSSKARPAIKDPLTDISKYDTILLGYPIWYGHIPNILMNQLELLNLEGKTIYPFNTHEGSGVGNSINEIKKYAPKAIIKNGFPVSWTDARGEISHERIKKWFGYIYSNGEINENDYL